MTVKSEEIMALALKRPGKERAAIAEKLISSLDGASNKNVEKAWQREIQLRLAEIDQGRVKCLPWEDVKARLYKHVSV